MYSFYTAYTRTLHVLVHMLADRYFCWMCMAKLRSSNPYSHYNTLEPDGSNASCMRQLFAIPPDMIADAEEDAGLQQEQQQQRPAEVAAAEENANDEIAGDAAQAQAARIAPENDIDPVPL